MELGLPGLDQLWSVAAPVVAADIILVHAGTNDLLQGQFSTAASDLEVLIRSLNYYNPTARILVAKIIPFSGPYESLNSQVFWFNIAVDNLVQSLKAQGWSRLDVVDMNTYFPKAIGLGADGIHPNDTGYWWMAQAWKQAITAVGCN
ncbi:GDSL-type esterase/lipase family protein [Hyalangium versicolor]|uniref:GDSL-type esterase/lipase family protein n=1 Tax=Hyalangium versicolor TaxID=2861190 RepID=UPI001CCFB53D|nr:GDSL-type esterase/lipase family protein [Hyalangium versicolor]